jgi:hypothetical protein
MNMRFGTWLVEGRLTSDSVKRISNYKLVHKIPHEHFIRRDSNRFAAVENLGTEVEINGAWETVKDNVQISAKESLDHCELKKHKPWFDEGWLKV